jgi:hypothetical protein
MVKLFDFSSKKVVEHGFLNENLIFSKKRDHGLKSEHSLDRPWSYFRDFTVFL